jgi:GxxExxY protein
MKRVCTHELIQRNIKVMRQVPMPITYGEIKLDAGYRIDLVVESSILLELKAVERMIPLYHAQLLSYLKLSGAKIGLLINFHTPLLKDGITRLSN